MTIKEVAEKYDISADTLRYYERVGMIPKVTRRPNGIRDYQESDLGWVELAICMRSAGLPIEVMIEYVKLYKEGDNTIPARLELLQEQMNALKEQKAQIESTVERLAYKISKYEEAMETHPCCIHSPSFLLHPVQGYHPPRESEDFLSGTPDLADRRFLFPCRYSYSSV